MNILRPTHSGRSVAGALSVYGQKIFMLCFWTLLLCLVIWLAKPAGNAHAQGDCLLECQQRLMQCLQVNNPECQDKYDDCTDACLNQ